VIAEHNAAAAMVCLRPQRPPCRKTVNAVILRRAASFVKQINKFQTLAMVSAKIRYFGYNSVMLKSQTAQAVLII
jgi:hypothetical protein